MSVLTILVVDDEPAIVRALTRVLSRAGHKVIGCIEPAAALEAARSEPPIDVVLTDLHLGTTHGGELALEILKHNPSARVILFTGDDLADLEDLPMRMLQKPVRGSRLLRVITGAELEEPPTTSAR